MQGRDVTVVTGSSTGIGRATADRLARAGDRVWALMRDPDDGADLADRARARGDELEVLRCDVTSEASVDEAFTEILRRDGRVDRLVSNAGIFVSEVLEVLPIAEIRDVFDVNYFGALRCVKKVLPGMREARSGHIVAVSSQSARVALPSWTAYSGSKRALEASLEVVATEVRGFGIRVSIVEPGITAPGMRPQIRAREGMADYEPVLRWYEAIMAADRTDPKTGDEVAELIALLLNRGDPPFRLAVGADTERNLAMRDRAGDDAWVELFAQGTDDGFFAEWTALSGRDDPRRVAHAALADPGQVDPR
jgi:NAD(P)-dependent dehydrogenase (short-subunit alcohol dehydrogenase family)